MRMVVQRCSHAACTVDGLCTGAIEKGLCVFVGFERGERLETLERMIEKLIHLRIFEDEQGKMNRSVLDVGGSILSISQFTLYADCKKGRRPSFVQAAPAKEAAMLYDTFNALLAEKIHVEKGIFQADMKIDLQNDGPVTILLDSKEVF